MLVRFVSKAEGQASLAYPRTGERNPTYVLLAATVVAKAATPKTLMAACLHSCKQMVISTAVVVVAQQKQQVNLDPTDQRKGQIISQPFQFFINEAEPGPSQWSDSPDHSVSMRRHHLGCWLARSSNTPWYLFRQ